MDAWLGSPSAAEQRRPQSRKRSRSGTRLPIAEARRRNVDPSRPTKHVLDLDQIMTRDQIRTAAMTKQALTRNELTESMKNSIEYYNKLRKEHDPGDIYGHGFAGYGNGVTGRKPHVVYPAHRARLGKRHAPALRVSRKDQDKQADQLEELVPIRIDIELDKIKLRDTFTWNLNDRVVTPDLFASTLVEDLRLPLDQNGTHRLLVNQVRQSIEEQILDYYPHVFIGEEALDPHLPYTAYKNDEMRIMIKLEISIGADTLMDQLEWDINNPLNSPEEFASQMTKDLSLPGEFTTAIAHSIREQCQFYTKSLYITKHPFDGRQIEDLDLKDGFLPSPLLVVHRSSTAIKEYTPYYWKLSEADMERTELAMSREMRRQKRSVNRRGGPALPDLKEKPRTVRTLVVSSVLPAAAGDIDSCKIYKVTRTTGRGKHRRGLAEGGDDSEESESEGSFPDSPAMSIQQIGGTARTRGMRGAASAAQAAMRANFGRSATPELSLLHHHETRTSLRRFGGDREESVADAFIVRIKMPRERYRQWWREYKTKQSQQQLHAQPAGYLPTPFSTSQRTTPQMATSMPGSMGPPSTPGIQNRQLPGQSPGKFMPQLQPPIPPPPPPADQWRYKPDGRIYAPGPQLSGQAVRSALSFRDFPP